MRSRHVSPNPHPNPNPNPNPNPSPSPNPDPSPNLNPNQAISLAPHWPKAYLRAARSLMSLERHAEAVTALEAALRHAPGAPVLMEAAAEARLLLRMQQRDERALASTSSVGDTDLVGIPRGRCCVRAKAGAGGGKAGEECACPAYVQRHRSMKIQLDGR